MLFETSGIEISWWIPPVTAFLISLFTSVGGVSGAFLLLPFQMSVLGFTSPAVSSTNHVFNIIAIPGGVMRFVREGRMLWPLSILIILGTLPGVLIGAYIRVEYLPDPGYFKIFAGFVLLYIGTRLVFNLLNKKKGNEKARQAESKYHSNSLKKGKVTNVDRTISVQKFDILRIRYSFMGDDFTVKNGPLFIISFLIGIIGGTYGIGGGAIISPILVAIFGLPVYTVAGAALMGTFVTSIAGVGFFRILAPYYPNLAVSPDWLLGLMFGLGGIAGIYLGARLQKYMPASLIKWILAVCILFLSLKYILSL